MTDQILGPSQLVPRGLLVHINFLIKHERTKGASI